VAIRVLLVEDSDVYRSALELLLPLEDGIEVIGAVATGVDAIAAATSLRPDVALVDLRLPGLDGIETTAALRRAAPLTAVVCLTAEATAGERAAVLEAGAVAVVDKDQPTQALAEALRDACPHVDRA
jgi:two-component system response regulator DesR